MPNPELTTPNSTNDDRWDTLGEEPTENINPDNTEKSIADHLDVESMDADDILALSDLENLDLTEHEIDQMIAKLEAEATPIESGNQASTIITPGAITTEISSDSTTTTENSPNASPAAIASYEQASQTQAPGLGNTISKRFIALIMAGAIALGGIVGIASTALFGNQASAPSDEPKSEQPANQAGENQEALQHKDGYYEAGMFMTKDNHDFADAKVVGETIGTNNPAEILIYTAMNQVESFADYLANLPTELQSEGYRGKSILETEEWLESLSDDQYNTELTRFAHIMRNNATPEMVTLNGSFQNAYMDKEGDGAATHENVKLVACTTQEDGTRAIRFNFHDDDGKELSSTMTVKISIKDIVYDEVHDETYYVIEGEGGCTQVVNPDGTVTYLYNGMKTIPNDPDNPGHPQNLPKDYGNLERIDEANEQNMAENNGSQTVNNYENPGVSQDEVTEAPAAESFGNTEANVKQNNSAPAAETVADQGHSADTGGAHDNEYQGRQADDTAQQTADNRGDAESVPTTDELDQMVKDLTQNQS